MPDRVCIDGRWYVAEDTIAVQRAPSQAEPYLPVKRLCAEYGVNVHRMYKAASDGTLDAPLPQDAVRGRKCRRSEFVRWMEEDLLMRRD